MFVPKSVLTIIHRHGDEKGNLGRATHLRSQIRLKKKAMTGGKNSDLFIILRLNALFGMKGMKVGFFASVL